MRRRKKTVGRLVIVFHFQLSECFESPITKPLLFFKKWGDRVKKNLQFVFNTDTSARKRATGNEILVGNIGLFCLF
jgi:hypothetical protein